MNNREVTKFSIAYMLSKRSGETSLFLGISALLLCFGIFFVTDSNDYTSMYEIANPIVWGIFFVSYSLINLYGIAFRISRYIRTFTSVAGLWGWNYVFLSFVVFDPTTVNVTDFFILLPIFAEVWNMLSLPSPNVWRERRKNNTHHVGHT